MALIEWRDDFAIGVASVDHEHRQLIAGINALRESAGADKAAVAAALGEIHARIAAHFALEERLMRERRYDRYAEHKADHERLLDDLRDIMDRHHDDDHFDDRAVLASGLRDWFGTHFRTEDARLHGSLGG